MVISVYPEEDFHKVKMNSQTVPIILAVIIIKTKGNTMQPLSAYGLARLPLLLG